MAVPASPNLISVPYSRPTGGVTRVRQGDDFQAALDRLLPGGTLQVDAGAAFVGNFVLRSKPDDDGWKYVECGTLGAPGSRVGPDDAFFKLVSPNEQPALRTEGRGVKWRFTQVHVTHDGDRCYNLVQIGDGSERAEDLAELVVFDRSYIHGTETSNTRRGVAANGKAIAVVDSYIADIHEVGADSQAVCTWAGPGPFKITGNYLEAAGENFLSGGQDPTIAGLVPSDIEFRNNLCRKPVEWRAKGWQVKNLFELKNAARVLATGNTFENNWRGAQNGYAILFTIRNQDGTAPWSVVEDVAFTDNVVAHSANGINILGTDDKQPSGTLSRLLIRNVLLDDIDGAAWGEKGTAFLVGNGGRDITIENCTARQTGAPLYLWLAPTTGLVFRANLLNAGDYGIVGDGTAGSPLATLARYAPDAIVGGNAFVGGGALESKYPLGNWFPSSAAEADPAIGYQGGATPVPTPPPPPAPTPGPVEPTPAPAPQPPPKPGRGKGNGRGRVVDTSPAPVPAVKPKPSFWARLFGRK